eukprot:5796020-Pyramimonas_sp.AAC.1
MQASSSGRAIFRGRVVRTSAAAEFTLDGRTYKYHVTQPGEKLMGVAKKYRTTVPDLMWFNGSMYLADISSDNGLKPERVIIVSPTRKSDPNLTYSLRDRALNEAKNIQEYLGKGVLPDETVPAYSRTNPTDVHLESAPI